MALALFDLDNTLLSDDSDYLWGAFLCEQGVVDEALYKRENQRFYDEYKQGTLDIHEFQAFSQQPLVDNDPDKMEQLRDLFIEQRIRPVMSTGSFELIAKHRDLGDTLVIITATNSFITRPIATAYDITHLIATEPERVAGQYTGKIAGTPCFQEGKVKRLQAWMDLQGMDMQGSWFYSDSHNDLPLLKEADNPVVVDADERLLNYAQQQGWPAISLRD
ncbi:Phosphoserine phosphatase [hydrothermal vent metagenome]|uniref:Phosphoserine phosphatase n=1 Tax=hydrothermal vent metagenome TaxID=652676 RepID=A0A3B0XDH2_9ZZZZ